MIRSVISLVTTSALLATGCSSAGRPWPARPEALASHTLSQVSTIDVLPLDLQLWAQPDYNIDLAHLREGTEDSIRNVALQALVQRSYAVGAVIDWNGDYAGGNAMSPPEVEATAAALSRYGALAGQHPAELPPPSLPVRLGGATGADATLYVGGWGYVAKPADHSTANKVLEGVVIGLVVLTVVVAVVAMLGGHGGGGGGHAAGSVAHAGAGAAHAGAHVGAGVMHAGGHPTGGANIGGGISGGGISGGGGGTQVGGAQIRLSRHLFTASRGAGVHGPRLARQVADAIGNTAQLAMGTDWGEDPTLPDSGDASQLYLEMTLVDNHTGQTLWHARQIFPADATSAADTARATKLMLARLPDRSAVPPGYDLGGR
ncbi:MAG TPA: hypothetical protein VGC42_17995 [Kofleriaceae bacterium]